MICQSFYVEASTNFNSTCIKFTENFQHHLIQVTQFPSLLWQCSHNTNNVYSNKRRDNPQKFNEINQNGRLISQEVKLSAL